jgi:hypothetical protein
MADMQDCATFINRSVWCQVPSGNDQARFCRAHQTYVSGRQWGPFITDKVECRYVIMAMQRIMDECGAGGGKF